jgi:hypothetical protein
MSKVVTGKVRFSYVKIFQPEVTDDGREKYSMCVLIPKKDAVTIKKIKSAIDEVKMSEKAKSKWGGRIPATLKTPLRDGDEEYPDKAEYAGMYFINASSYGQKPGVVDAGLNPVIDSTEVYSGCYGRVSISLYPYANTGNKGIAVALNNVQKLEDGDNLSGRTKAEDDFKDGFEDDIL